MKAVKLNKEKKKKQVCDEIMAQGLRLWKNVQFFCLTSSHFSCKKKNISISKISKFNLIKIFYLTVVVLIGSFIIFEAWIHQLLFETKSHEIVWHFENSFLRPISFEGIFSPLRGRKGKQEAWLIDIFGLTIFYISGG